MAKHVIKQDQADTVAATESNSEWVVEKDVALSGAIGLENHDFDGVAFTIAGNIVTNGVGIVSVGIAAGESADNTTVAIRPAGQIRTTAAGLYLEGTGIEIENAGVIKSEFLHAIYLVAGDAVLRNSGRILSTEDRAIQLEDCTGFLIENDGRIATIAGTSSIYADTSGDGRLVNGKHGVIDGIIHLADSDGNVTVVNKGRIFGNDSVPPTAVNFGTGDDHLINRGEIKGTVFLGDGDDRVDLRGGTLTNAIVFGNIGNDLFIVDDADAQVYESDGEGSDTVRATVSFALSDSVDIEILLAAGGKSLTLAGNIDDNILRGNAAGNKLFGGDGGDLLWGLGGNDRLTGGAGVDYFAFGAKGGIDTITDFVLGEDKIQLNEIAGIDDFTDLESRMTGVDTDGDGFQDDNTIIDLGGGDRIRLVGVDKAMLDVDDFDIPL